MTALGPGPRHPVRAGYPRQPDLSVRLHVQAMLESRAQQLPALHGRQLLHRIQRHHRPARPGQLIYQHGQHARQRPQPRHHRLHAGHQRIQHIRFHPRLPFR